MQFPAWLRSPHFEDEERQRVGRILYFLLLTFLIADMAIIVVYLFARDLPVLIALLTALAILFIGFQLLARGNLDSASQLLLFGLLLLVTYLLWIGQGIHDTGLTLYPIVIITAALLLPTMRFVLMVGLTLLSVALITFAELLGFYQTDHASLTGVDDFLTVSIILVVTAVAIRLLADDLRESLRRARQNEQALAESNARLQSQATRLGASEARWRTLVENAPDWIMDVRRDGLVHYTNRPAPLGQAQTVYDLVPEGQRTLVEGALDAVFISGRSTQFEIQAATQAVNPGWYSVRLGPVVEGGTVTTVTVIATDITERKVAEAILRESEIRYGSLFEDSPIALWEGDFSAVRKRLMAHAPDNGDWLTLLSTKPRLVINALRQIKLLDVNQATLALFNADSKEHLLSNLTRLFDENALPALQSGLSMLATGAKRFAGDFQLRKLTGERMTCALELAFAPGNETSWEKVFISVIDMTGRRAAEAEREKLIAELEAKNAELERFTYTVSHDLKSPLITIKGFLGFVEQDVASEDETQLKADLQHIRDAADSMQGLLDDLLELSRIGRLVNEPELAPFGNLVEEALERVAGQVVMSGAEIVIAPDMPAVFGDRSRLVDALQNLIDNALKFRRPRVTPEIEIGFRTGSPPTFFIRDNGRGIDPAQHGRVFALFDRLDSDVKGTGIGLALVKRIIEVHGGTIWLESAGRGHGATFFFTLEDPPAGEAY